MAHPAIEDTRNVSQSTPWLPPSKKDGPHVGEIRG